MVHRGLNHGLQVEGPGQCRVVYGFLTGLSFVDRGAVRFGSLTYFLLYLAVLRGIWQ